MSKKIQFLLFMSIMALISIVVSWSLLAPLKEPDNLTFFQIKNGAVVKYLGTESVVELPYAYSLDNDKVVSGEQYKVKYLNEDAFSKNNNIVRLAISHHIKEIKAGAFNNLENVEILIVRGNNPPQINLSEITKLTNLKQIYVYESGYQSYLESAVWGVYADIIDVI